MKTSPDLSRASSNRYAVRSSLAATAAIAIAVLSGCSKQSNSITEQANSGDQKGYISGDGRIESIAPQDRLDPVTIEGTTFTGEQWSSQDLIGSKIIVFNLWGSWCPPCIEEIPDLQQVWEEVQAAGKPVQFMGLDFRESPERGRAFAKSIGMTYPNLEHDDQLILGFGQQAPVSPPATIVVDMEGRVAARVNGMVDATTLTGIIDDVLAAT